jgi:hypothetical protein
VNRSVAATTTDIRSVEGAALYLPGLKKPLLSISLVSLAAARHSGRQVQAAVYVNEFSDKTYVYVNANDGNLRS